MKKKGEHKKLALQALRNWFEHQGWKPFEFQEKTWKAYLNGKSGLLNAPTGSGKTYALLLPVLAEWMRAHPEDYKDKSKNGLQLIWITPIRALAKEIQMAAQRAVDGLNIPWEVGIRTGDTKASVRKKQSDRMPEILITTPESLHLLLAQKDYPKRFKNLQALVADEWHELMGSKRGVQMELALSRLKAMRPSLKCWAISATIGNLDTALDVFLGQAFDPSKTKLIRSGIHKKIEVKSVLPDSVEQLPWAGHLGITLLEKVIPIVMLSKSTLIFTNTRSQTEIWYQRILETAPDLAGQIAMHHGSISRELREWVEGAIHDETLKAVVCTSSLDLGVDFRPVETIIQIGSPKGVARFIQRAGRSGHQPHAISRIYFVPTHSLELIEAAALRKAIDHQIIEERQPYVRSFDVLAQYLVTLSVSEGFDPQETWKEVKQTHAFETMTEEEWNWVLRFITTGGESLNAYDEYQKVHLVDGKYHCTSRRTAMRHRLSIGTIVSDAVMRVKYMKGTYIGTIEEWFISKLSPGDVFWFAGRNLELVKIKGMDVLVRKSKAKTGKVPSWMGGRMPLSSQMAAVLRDKMQEAQSGKSADIEIQKLKPLMEIQRERSEIPKSYQLLMEVLKSREGHHLFVYPFEGRFVHEAIASLLAYRFSLLQPISFSLAYNDYGLELLSDQPIPVQDGLDNNFFTQEHLMDDLWGSINASEMARRKFRDIAGIVGLVFKGFPGKYKKDKHLQSSSQLFFDVFEDYDPENLLLRQAYNEVMEFQLEEGRLRQALDRISQQEILVKYTKKPSPFAFPIMVDRLREKLSSEKLEDRVKRMQVQFAD